MTDVTLLMYHLKMPSELIDVIEQLAAECTCGVEENEVAVLAELALLDVALVGGLGVEGLLGVDALAVGEADVAVELFVACV